MTEEEWMACEDVAKLLKRGRLSSDDRKSRLLICAWCRRRWDVLDERYQRAVEVGEQYADGLATATDLDNVRAGARTARKMYGVQFAYARKIQYTDVLGASAHLAYYPYDIGDAEKAQARAAEKRIQVALLRDVFGNPFRPSSINPAWRTSDVRLLARGIYDDRAFDRIPILADALQDAGCDNDDVLTHLRDTTATHVRGCWALDLVLGKV
jgi:hypothetical protein